MSNTSYKQVFENNKKWVEAMTDENPDFFKKLSEAQYPDYLFIGCADSRVPANQIMGLNPGDVFVHRNIANMVVSTDLNAQSVIEYAVVHLGVKHIVVCGHYGCGGVNAAMQAKDLGLLNGWLRNIRDVARIHQGELNQISDEKKKFDRLVELNVQEQCINVIKVASVQKAYNEKQFPMVHGWVYDIGNGILKDLDLDFDSILKDIQKIYDLH